MVTTMFYHFLAPEGGHPTREEKIQKYKVLFSKPHRYTLSTKAVIFVLKSAANTYPSSKYEYVPVILLLTNHEALST